ncbi:MAG: helix-turn-helix domain-containing protein [Lepagella sp.]
MIVREVVEREGYRDMTITREVLSERVGCNHTYLSETIKHKTGMTYSRYMNSVRINKAVQLLTAGTEMSFEELSRYVGFLSVKTFYTSFKEFIGIPPGSFREILSKQKNESSD